MATGAAGRLVRVEPELSANEPVDYYYKTDGDEEYISNICYAKLSH